MEVDKKLLNNVLDNAKRLKSQLADLEEYRDSFDDKEYEEMKENTRVQLIENANLLESLTSGSLKASNETDEAKKQLAKMIIENYNVKDLLGTFLAKEKDYLRENIAILKRKLSIGRINIDDYQVQLTQLLNAIEGVTELNDDEKKLKQYINDKAILSKYTIDQGLSKDNIENKIKK